MRSLTAGILAHVDAGKTTCIENILYQANVIRKPGRVDHQDAFLDFDEQERARGITIYSKQAGVQWKDAFINIIDTPGHADFSSEMEKVLSVLDAAIVVVSGLDGVQSHTKTIWKCLEHYKIPALVFVNKMDLTTRSKEELLSQCKKELSGDLIDLEAEDADEQIASMSDELLESYLESGELDENLVRNAFANRKGFPVVFGSALKGDNVDFLLDSLIRFAPDIHYPNTFGARVFNVSHDENSNPMYHLKITGGELKIKDEINGQKVNQIRIYQGSGYARAEKAIAGQICTLCQFSGLAAGQGLGFEKDQSRPVLQSCLVYELILPRECDPVQMMGYCRLLMMEDPSLEIEMEQRTKAIHVHLMGDIQQQILQERLESLSGFKVGFGPGKIVYKETITEPVFGYGHFEPLRHYAEVHVLLEPLPAGSGIEVTSKISRDTLSLSWQRNILNHLTAREIRGVLTNSALTDVKITLIAGKAHPKHTESTDFRQAAFRAVRQALMKTPSVLLEPAVSFTVYASSQMLSRILYDLESRQAQVSVEENEGDIVITGKGPLRLLRNYQSDLNALSKGAGRIVMESDGYIECQDAAQIIEEIHYDPLNDRYNSPDSVFCSNGSGVIIDWSEAEEHMHIPVFTERSSDWSMNSSHVSAEESAAVFARAGGQNQPSKKKKGNAAPKKVALDLQNKTEVTAGRKLPVCLIVDGYNMIYAWDELKEIARTSLSAARERLIDLVVNFQGYKGWSLIIVFDGWKRNDNSGSTTRNGSSTIVYTRTGMSADSYIEKRTAELKGKFDCIVATSDSLIQNSILGSNARRMSARELELSCRQVNENAFKAISKR
jgi:small GTP-binding protein